MHDHIKGLNVWKYFVINVIIILLTNDMNWLKQPYIKFDY